VLKPRSSGSSGRKSHSSRCSLSQAYYRYKILFLDVLFPMDLDKVIFVDAGKQIYPGEIHLQQRLDQIVRVDMKELVEVDLHGRVYGYPPMGNDRTEMEGFRFWKTGYWKDALHGRPYHIRLGPSPSFLLALVH